MEFMKKGGFSESEIHIYDKVPDDFITNAELENMASDETNLVTEIGETLDASETEVKFYDAVTPNDGDSASKQGAAATISRDETEHVQRNATDLSNPRKAQCTVVKVKRCCNVLSATGAFILLVLDYQYTRSRCSEIQSANSCVSHAFRIQAKYRRRTLASLIQNLYQTRAP